MADGREGSQESSPSDSDREAEPPPDRCGYEWPADCERIAGKSSAVGQFSCVRPPLSDAERCVWHADPTASDAKTVEALRNARVSDGFQGLAPSSVDVFDGANLSGMDLEAIQFVETRLRGADLSGTDLEGADLSGAYLQLADLSEANLWATDLSGANLGGAVLSGANLGGAVLSGAYLRNAALSEANLRHADLSEADLRGATLDHVGLYDTTLKNVAVDEGATARPPSLWERQADAAAESGVFQWVGFRRFRALGRSASSPTKLQWAEQQYRRIERLYREHDLKPEPALAVQEKHARRKRALAEGNLFQWLQRAFSRWILGYGLLIRPILGVMLAVIVGWALAYPALGFEDGSLAVGATETATVAYETVPPELSWATAETVGRSLYFSTITFSTLGYADVFPTGWARVLATVESFIGALSMAYLVSVLSRRAIR